MLKELTESLFEETIKQVAAKVWEARIVNLDESLKGPSGGYSMRMVLEAQTQKLAKELLQNDEDLKAKLKEAIAKELDRILTP